MRRVHIYIYIECSMLRKRRPQTRSETKAGDADRWVWCVLKKGQSRQDFENNTFKSRNNTNNNGNFKCCIGS